jgi:hypothetical protein
MITNYTSLARFVGLKNSEFYYSLRDYLWVMEGSKVSALALSTVEATDASSVTCLLAPG